MRISVTMTDKQAQMLREAAAREGLKLGDWLRALGIKAVKEGA